MMSTALAPQVPPRWRLTTVGLALLLVLAALSLFATLADEWRRPLTETLDTLQGAPSVHGSAHGQTQAATQALIAWMPSAFAARAITVLTTATCTLGLAALLLALAQRSLHDLALAGAAALWALLFQLSARSMALVEPAPVFNVGAQTVFVSAVGLSLWYGLHLLKRTALQPHPMPMPRLLVLSSGVALLLAMAGVVTQPFYWVLPIASVLVCSSALVRMVDMARRPGSQLRPSPAAWLLAISVACAIASGSRELWLRMAEPVSAQALWGAWLVTRASIVLVLACALGLRLDQLARMLRQLGSSHGTWRQRLRDVQRLLAQARERLALADRGDQQRAQRDHMLRELHDDVGHRLLAALTALQQHEQGSHAARPLQQLLDGSLIELRLAHDALGGVPRPLVEAMQDLRQQLAPLLQEAGADLRWAIEGPAQTLVLSSAETLQLLRIVRQALGSTLDRATDAPLRTVCKWMLDVADGETGRHLRLRVSDEPASAAPAPARLGAEWIRLQRQATSLGAQLALDPQAGPARSGWAIELVMPLNGR